MCVSGLKYVILYLMSLLLYNLYTAAVLPVLYLLLDQSKTCTSYRRTLRVLYDRWCKSNSDELSSSSSHTNNRYFNTPERLAKVSKLRQRVRNAEFEIARLKERVCTLIQESSSVDQGLREDLFSIMKGKTSEVYKAFPEGPFHRVFWDQQLANAKKSETRLYRWYPLIIKWCLNLKLLSSAAYHALRSSGFITLISERTLYQLYKV